MFGAKVGTLGLISSGNFVPAPSDPLFASVVSLQQDGTSVIDDVIIGRSWAVGGTVTLDTGGGAFGENGALISDSSNSGIVDDSDFFDPTNDFTIDVTVNSNALPSGGADFFDTIFSHSNTTGASNRGWAFLLNDGKIYWRDKNGSELIPPTAHGLVVGTDSALTFERWLDGGTWRNSVFKDGTLLASGTGGVLTQAAQSVFSWGIFYNLLEHSFDGTLSQRRITHAARHQGAAFAAYTEPFPTQ